MIQYRKTQAEVEALIEAESPGWLQQATARTEEFRSKGCYAEARAIWSAVKPAYMHLQGASKCAYCERKLESVTFGKGEQAVDHFRPKRSVKAWPAGKRLAQQQGIPFTAAPAPGKGYYLLPYHPFNYAAACNPCNSILKKDYFPIAGSYHLAGEDPVPLQKELPYLIYPIGDFDVPPEALIEFYGISPRPVAKSGHDRHRALVTIEFFQLGDENGRKNLFLERARLLILLFPQLEAMHRSELPAERNTAAALVEKCMQPTMAHANCCRSFQRLYDRSNVEAKEIYDLARRFVSSSS